MATAKGSLSIGGSRNESLTASGEQDTFTVDLVAGYNYQFVLTAAANFTSNANALFETLIGPNNVAVPSSQLSAGGNVSRSIAITPATSGTYTLSVANTANATGGYTLTATPQDDIGTTPGQLAIGGTTTGVLESAGDKDAFTVDLTAGFNYQFLLAATADFTSNANALFETLIGPNNIVVPNNQLSAGGNTSRSIAITPTTSGSYTLSVANTANATGSYVLTATPQDDIGTTPRTLAIGSSTTATLESAGDKDTFTVALTAGSNYQFVLTPAASFTSNSNALFETLIGPNNVVVPNSQLSAGSNTSRSLAITPTTSGTYTLSVANTANATGAYTLASVGPSIPGIPVYRFFDSNTGTQFLTSDLSERNTVIATRPDLVNEGAALEAASASDPNGSPVYRFFDKIYGTHFFTSSSSERDTIQATRSDLSFEGVGFNEYLSQQANSTAVYRFFDTNRGTHFFTSSASEKATITATRADLTYEGISFYAPTT